MKEAPTKENTLYLPIKQIYFDQIIEQTKKEEYREIKDTTASRYLIKDVVTKYKLDPKTTDSKKIYSIEDYNKGNFPFLHREYKYLYMAVGYAKLRDTALVEITGYSFLSGYVRSRLYTDWVIAYELGEIVELHRK